MNESDKPKSGRTPKIYTGPTLREYKPIDQRG